MQPRDLPFETILRSSPTATLLVDESAKICYANEAARSLLGLSNTDDLSSLDRTLPLAASLAGVGRNSKLSPFSSTIAYLCHDLVVELWVRVRPVLASPSTYWSVVELTPSHEPHWYAESNEHLDRLVAMGQTIAGFAHEVRNPLAALKMLVEGLETGLAPGEPYAEEMGRIGRLVLRLEHLVKSSLQFGQPAIRLPEWHSPVALLGAVLEMLLPRLREMGSNGQNQLDVAIGTSLPDVFVDPEQIQQVLVILVNNALDATGDPAGVKLEVQASHRREDGARCVRFDVVDTGPGIAPDVKSQIFNPFFTTKPKGTGLGLSIALKLANQNRARVLLQSELGAGSVFSLEIPAREVQRTDARESSVPPPRVAAENAVETSRPRKPRNR